jgi:hypothetical protein
MASNREPPGIRSSAFKTNSATSTKKSYRTRTHMWSQAQRTTILELNTQGVSKREIARGAGGLPRSGSSISATSSTAWRQPGRCPPARASARMMTLSSAFLFPVLFGRLGQFNQALMDQSWRAPTPGYYGVREEVGAD